MPNLEHPSDDILERIAKFAANGKGTVSTPRPPLAIATPTRLY